MEWPSKLGENSRRVFLEGAREQINQARTLLSLETEAVDRQQLMDLRRYCQALRATGQLLGLRTAVKPAVAILAGLELVLDYEMPVEPPLTSFLQDKLEIIENELNDKIAALEEEEAPPPGSAGDPVVILVVDDDRLVHRLVRRHLEPAGFQVQSVYSGEEALESLQERVPDLILLDRIMPGINGEEFCRIVKGEERWKLVPVIFLTVQTELDERLQGFAVGADDYLGKPFHPEELLARVRSLLGRYEQYQRMATQDVITGLYNRRYFEDRLQEELNQAQREGQHFALALLDIDQFKNINDTFGHRTGDRALMAVAGAMRQSLRRRDVICRYGGDEFIALLPNTPPETGRQVLSRLCREVGNLRVENELGDPVSISVSVGLVGYPDHGGDAESLLRKADEMLYRAKHLGRDQICMA